MMETLVMTLPATHDNRVHYACYEAAGGLIQQEYHADVALLAQHAVGRRVVVVVPSLAVACLRVTLPKLSSRALHSALPYALEDQLIASPESLHYTLLACRPNAESEVLVVDKALMQSWLTTCATWGIEPDVLIPSAFMLKHEPDVWTVAMHEDANLRVNEHVGFACDLDNLNAVLTQAFHTYGQPKALQVYATTKTALEMTVPIMETLVSASAMMDLSLSLPVGELACNLRHGEFQVRKKPAVNQARVKQVLSLGLSVCLVLVLMFPMASWLMLTLESASLQRSMMAIAKPYGGEPRSVEAAHAQMEHQWSQASAGQGDHALLHLLADVGQSMKVAPGLQIDKLVFQAGQLMLSVSAQTPDIFSSWSQALSAKGLEVKENSAIITGGRVNASVTIRKS